MPVLITPLRASNASVGLAKEVTPGTPVAPSNFIRWLDGTSIATEISDEEIVEGDTSRHVGLDIKNKQLTKIKLVCWARPINSQLLGQASLGSGSDIVTAPIVNHTIATSSPAGSTTITLEASTGLTGAGTAAIGVAPGAANEEIALVTTPGAANVFTLANGAVTRFLHQGPVTTTTATAVAAPGSATIVVTASTNILVGSSLSISGGVGTPETVIVTAIAGTNVTAVFANTHSGTTNVTATADAVRSATIHTETDANDGDYWTVEVNLGGASGLTIRVRDCKVDQYKVTGDMGKLIKLEVDFIGIACAVQGSPSTVTLENHQPFLYTQASGAWTLDGLTTGDALAIQKFDVTVKNNLDQIQAEQVTLAAMLYAKFQVDANVEVIYTPNTNARLQNIFFGGPAGVSDAQAVFVGSFQTTFTAADTLHSLLYNVPFLNWIKGPYPVPKGDGKAFTVPLSGKGTSNNGNSAFAFQQIVNNLQTAAF